MSNRTFVALGVLITLVTVVCMVLGGVRERAAYQRDLAIARGCAEVLR